MLPVRAHAAGWLKQALGAAKTAAEVMAAYGTLTEGDRALEPNYRPTGVPNVPAHCTTPTGEQSGGCNACYAAASRKLTAVRVAFEKLRRVGTTTEAFAKKSIAFGDGVSGIHGAAAIGWRPERQKIETSLAGFHRAYDAKHEELVGLLEAALRDVGACEARYFDVPDWYDRYGFMYHAFMADRYRR